MPIKLTPVLCAHIPDLVDILIGTSKGLAIRAQDKGPNFVGIANEGMAELFSMQIPNFDGSQLLLTRVCPSGLRATDKPDPYAQRE